MFDVLGSSALPASVPKASGDEPLTVRNLRDTLATIEELSATADAQLVRLQEAWNDALKFKQDALAAFRLGYMGLPDRATAEQLTWACADAIAQRLPKDQAIPEELAALNKALAGTYYANLSIFRSAPDTWAIDQLFPVVPIQQLDQRPTRLANLADLTCDSDGRLDRFIGDQLLELHDLDGYLIGLFPAVPIRRVLPTCSAPPTPCTFAWIALTTSCGVTPMPMCWTWARPGSPSTTASFDRPGFKQPANLADGRLATCCTSIIPSSARPVIQLARPPILILLDNAVLPFSCTPRSAHPCSGHQRRALLDGACRR